MGAETASRFRSHVYVRVDASVDERRRHVSACERLLSEVIIVIYNSICGNDIKLLGR